MQTLWVRRFSFPPFYSCWFFDVGAGIGDVHPTLSFTFNPAFLQERLEDVGAIYKGSYDGWYSISDEAFLSESQVVDVAGSDGGNSSPSKVCADTGNAVIWMSEENYMFRLSDYAQPLLKWLDENPDGSLSIVCGFFSVLSLYRCFFFFPSRHNCRSISPPLFFFSLVFFPFSSTIFLLLIICLTMHASGLYVCALFFFISDSSKVSGGRGQDND